MPFFELQSKCSLSADEQQYENFYRINEKQMHIILPITSCRKNGERINTKRVFFTALFFLILAHPALAQISPVAYIDSITEDEEGNRLSFPHAVFIDPVKKEIYILSQSRVILYTSDFFPIFTLDKSVGIETPQGLTVDADGNLFVTQSATKENPRHRISVFNACLKWVRDIHIEGFEGAESFIPYRIAVDKKGNIYVSGNNFPGVLLLNKQGKLLQILSPEEEGNKVKLNYVTGDYAGRIYLVSEEKGHIYVYNSNGEFLFKFGQKGGSSGKLSRPQAVAIDQKTGMFYVVDYMRHTILAYDDQGNYLFEFGGLGWGEGWFQYPKDVAVDSQGRIFIADTFNDRIDVFKPNE